MLLADGLPFVVVLVSLCLFAFAAGAVDAAVGGGGLVQLPALLNLLPDTPPATLYGTNKLSSVCGTSFAARSFIRKVRIPWPLVLPAAISAFIFSFAGAATVSLIPPTILRPLILVLLVLMAIYTFWKKDFGKLHKPSHIGRKESVLAVLLGGAIGFYDGLFGPGTGSFLIFLFIRFFALDFVHASASAKVVNIATNVASLVFFIPTGNVLYLLALPMAVCNVLGALTGTWVAVHKGSGFIRLLFLVLLVILIAKLGYDSLPQ
nr:sulfite exporter TauE/SafE family protein [Pseudomonas sp.]